MNRALLSSVDSFWVGVLGTSEGAWQNPDYVADRNRMQGNGLLITVEKGLPRGLVTREQPALSDSAPGGDQGLWEGTQA